jgi:hypothetical protein
MTKRSAKIATNYKNEKRVLHVFARDAPPKVRRANYSSRYADLQRSRDDERLHYPKELPCGDILPNVYAMCGCYTYVQGAAQLSVARVAHHDNVYYVVTSCKILFSQQKKFAFQTYRRTIIRRSSPDVDLPSMHSIYNYD